MLSQEFKLNALRTNNPHTGTYGTNPDLIHAVLGFTSEINEFVDAIGHKNIPNMFEELGDMFWFVALFEDATGLVVNYTDHYHDDCDPITCMGTLTDLLKAHYAYGAKKDMSQAEIESVMADVIGANLQAMLVTAAQVTNQTNILGIILGIAEKAQATVINKLKARYPDKFQTEHALKRDLGYENEVIAKSMES